MIRRPVYGSFKSRREFTGKIRDNLIQKINFVI